MRYWSERVVGVVVTSRARIHAAGLTVAHLDPGDRERSLPVDRPDLPRLSHEEVDQLT